MAPASGQLALGAGDGSLQAPTPTAGGELLTTARVVDRYDKRGREYVDIAAFVVTADAPDALLWESWVTFTPTATLGVT